MFVRHLWILVSAAALAVASGSVAPRAAGATTVAASGDSPFWNLFSDNYRVNCRRWKHNLAHNPVIPAGKELWSKNWTANPAVVDFQGKSLLYYRGNGVTPQNPARHDRIAVARITRVTADDLAFENLNHHQFVVDIGKKGSFDDSDVLDPGVVVFQGRVFLYYSGVGTGPNAVGLAVSHDGVSFEKLGKVITGRSPSAVVADDKIYMIYQHDSGQGYRGFFLAVSDDGKKFANVSDEPVLGGREGEWDKFIATARIYKENGTFLLLYGGSPDLNDQPDYFGLARSKDLRFWEKHPGNPIFGLSAKGEEDGGAIWFPALIDIGGHYVMLYEGSRGRYAWDISSQICMSSIAKKK